MRKGLITKVNPEFMLVMSDSMSIEKIKTRENISVGQRIEYSPKDLYRGFRLFNIKRLFLVVTLLIITLTSVVVYAVNGDSQAVEATISIDINPSIEFDINKNGEVINIRFLNEDASLLSLGDLKGESLTLAFQEVILSAQAQGYLEINGNILIATKYTNDINENVSDDVISFMDDHKDKFRFVYIEVENDSMEIQENEVSIGRQYIASELDIEVDEIVKESVTTIFEEIENNIQNNDDPIKVKDTEKEEVFKDEEGKLLEEQMEDEVSQEVEIIEIISSNKVLVKNVVTLETKVVASAEAEDKEDAKNSGAQLKEIEALVEESKVEEEREEAEETAKEAEETAKEAEKEAEEVAKEAEEEAKEAEKAAKEAEKEAEEAAKEAEEAAKEAEEAVKEAEKEAKEAEKEEAEEAAEEAGEEAEKEAAEAEKEAAKEAEKEAEEAEKAAKEAAKEADDDDDDNDEDDKKISNNRI